jgi:hypothetical protein
VVTATSSETYSNSSCYSSCTYAFSCPGCAALCADRGYTYASRLSGTACRCSMMNCPTNCICALGIASQYVYENNAWQYAGEVPVDAVWNCPLHTWCN